MRSSIAPVVNVPLFQMRGVRKSFGDNAVLKGVDLDVYPEEILAILGPSGCGKSVLLKAMIGLLELDAGTVSFDGKPLSQMKEPELIDLRRRVGMVFQYGALFDSLTVGDNVAYGLKEHYAQTMTREDMRRRVEWALTAVGLPGTEELYPSALSGGMRKRAGVARTLAVRPEVVLYDEPTMGLDPINTTRIGRVVRHLSSELKITSVMVTHDMKLAFEAADRIAMLDEGVVLGIGTPDELRVHPDERVRDFINGTDPEWTAEDEAALQQG